MAARRRTTPNALVEHAMGRELLPPSAKENPNATKFDVGPFGLLRLKHREEVNCYPPSNSIGAR